MTQPNWNEMVKDKAVAANPNLLWVRVCDYIRGPRKIMIKAEGTWNYDSRAACGPDGNPGEGFSDANLHDSALRGCLIAKVGGSAGETPGKGKIQAVGSFCSFEIGADAAGALYLAMNDAPKNFYKHSGTLTVTISEAS